MRHAACLLIGFLVSVPCWVSAESVSLLRDGFGDGDLNNDQRRVERVEDRSDVGAAWFMSRGTSDFRLGIADDTAGIGTGNTLAIKVSRGTNRSVGATFPEFALEQIGDAISLTFDIHVITPLNEVQHERRFRFGLYHDGGTPVREDTADANVTQDDLGYFVQMDVGQPDGTTADIRGNINQTLLGGSYNQTFGANTDDASGALNGNQRKTVKLSIVRAENDDKTEKSDDFRLELDVDGSTLISRHLSRNAKDPVAGKFNTVYFGTSNVVLEYRLDNIHVEAERDN